MQLVAPFRMWPQETLLFVRQQATLLSIGRLRKRSTPRGSCYCAARSDSLRVIMVTSAGSGEGKTSLSTHLAASLAQTNLRTLLIDGDLRNPIMHQVFGLELVPGFCELLRAETTGEAVIRTTSVDGLWLIPAGRWSSGASRCWLRTALPADSSSDLGRSMIS